MSSSNRLIVAILVVTAVAVGFWILLLAPKREEANKLSGEVNALSVSLVEAQGRAAEAVAAREDFPVDYRQLVVLGQAVPASDETASLLIELNRVARESKVDFEGFQLSSEGGGEAVAAPAPLPAPSTEAATGGASSAVPAAATVPPTEVAAALMPLGATVGPAGLGVMPYDLTFTGSFFEVADFIAEIDSMVHTGDANVEVEGRLMTIDGFALSQEAAEEGDTSQLNATFSVTTYLVPPDQGVTAGATPTAPPPATTAPASESPAEPSESEETVSAR
jgi:Tfp pilus assembly protein PilO